MVFSINLGYLTISSIILVYNGPTLMSIWIISSWGPTLMSILLLIWSTLMSIWIIYLGFILIISWLYLGDRLLCQSDFLETDSYVNLNLNLIDSYVNLNYISWFYLDYILVISWGPTLMSIWFLGDRLLCQSKLYLG